MIYYAQDLNSYFIKIGCSNRPVDRINELHFKGEKRNVALLKITGGMYKKEKEVHNRLKESLIYAEWYFPTKDVIYYLNQVEGQIFNSPIIPIPDKEIDNFIKHTFKFSYLPSKYRIKKEEKKIVPNDL